MSSLEGWDEFGVEEGGFEVFETGSDVSGGSEVLWVSGWVEEGRREVCEWRKEERRGAKEKEGRRDERDPDR